MSESPAKLKRVYVAGHQGMVGSAIARVLKRRGDCEIVTRTRAELDLMDQASVRHFFETEPIDQVYSAAAKVGGIYANDSFPAEFIYQNLMVELNLVHEAWVAGVPKLLMLGSSCIYPKAASQPMEEGALLTGKLERTNEPYAVAKIAGIKLCESYNRQYGVDYRSVMPTNLYGPGDNYHPENSHVIPGLLRRIHEAKINGLPSVSVWGSGKPRREFLFVDDMAEACVFVMNLDVEKFCAHVDPMESHVNVGFGRDIAIRELAELIAKVVGFRGYIEFDPSKPDGTPRKLLDSSRLRRLGWEPRTSLEAGLARTYEAYLLQSDRTPAS
jgi:GDP-L-fucose synthase